MASTKIILYRADPEENMDRFYIVTVQASLLAPVAVIIQYGSRHTAYQRTRVLPVDDAAAAAELADKIVEEKIRSGYELVK